MNALLALWLPILLSAVFVFIASSLIHMVFKWHASDYRGLPNEDAVREILRAGNATPGLYTLPYCPEMKEMGSAAMTKKYQEGPVAFLRVGPNGPPNMGRSLLQWFLLTIVVGVIAAFLATQIFGLDPNRARAAAKLVGAVSFLAYGFGAIQESIWMFQSWSSTAKFLLDAAIYAVVAAFTFYWLWP